MITLRLLKTLLIACIAILPLVSIAADGGTLTILPDQAMAYERDFNPLGSGFGAQYAPDFIYERLYFRNSLHPEVEYFRLAESYQFSNNLTAIDFTLRKNLKWSDGTVLTSQDVIFTVDYLRTHPEFNQGNVNLYNSQSNSGVIVKAQALDSRRIRFSLNQPNSLAAEQIGRMMVLPKHVFELIEEPKNFKDTQPVGSGPFTEVVHYNVHSIKMCRNPYYFETSLPHVDCIRIPMLSDNTMLWAQTRLGKINWMSIGTGNPQKNFAEKHPGNKFYLGPGYNVVFSLNTTKSPFDKLPVRQAMSIALDRSKMLREDTYGLTTPNEFPIGTGALYKAWFDENRLESTRWLMQQDLNHARTLLDQADIIDRDGDGWRDNPDGTPIDIEISVPTGWTDWVNTCARAVSNWRNVGLNSHLKTPSDVDWRARVPSGDFDVYIQVTGLTSNPIQPYAEMFDPNSMIPGQVSMPAMHQYSLPEVNDLVNRFLTTTEQSEQYQIMNRIYELVAEHLPVLTLFSNPDWYEYNDEEFTGFVTKENPYVRPVIWNNNPERLIHILNIEKRDS